MPSVEINYLAIAIASIVCFAIGTFWYSPALFGNRWMNLIGKSSEELHSKSSLKYYCGAYVAIVLLCFVMAHIVDYVGATKMNSGVLIGIIIWAGFSAPITAISYLFERRPLALYFINSGYYLVICVISGTLLAMMK
jgi:hypothetical protein